MLSSQGQPFDWTNGAGAFSGTTISLPANAYRRSLYIQNLDTTTVSVAIAGAKASDGTACTVTIPLAPAASTGAPGGIFDRHAFNWVPVSAITITGTNGSKIACWES